MPASSSAMQVVVTRPEREAKAWVQALCEAGHEPLALPLMAFESVSPPLLSPLATYRALMFVSPQAAASFFDKKNHLWQYHQAIDAIIFNNSIDPLPRCWAPGPGTARALLQAGVPADRIDQPDPQGAQFDSEALWQVVRGQVGLGDRVLIVRGETEGPTAISTTSTTSTTSANAPRQGHGRDWLAQQCQAVGASVAYAVVYRRVRPVWSDEQRQHATKAVGRALWLFSNTEALGHLAELLPHSSWQTTTAIATHPRVAQAARGLGFTNLYICRPDLADVLTMVNRVIAVGK